MLVLHGTYKDRSHTLSILSTEETYGYSGKLIYSRHLMYSASYVRTSAREREDEEYAFML